MNVIRGFKILKLLYRRASSDYQQYLRVKELEAKGSGLIIAGDINVQGNLDNISIGDKTKINAGVYVNLGGEHYGGEGSMTIGKNTIISNSSILYAGGGRIEIGDFCDIANGVFLLAHTRHSLYNPVTDMGEKFSHSKISIGNACNIGSGAIILGNTVIGNHCVIAAGSIVSGSYGDYMLLAGNPIKAIPLPRD